MNEALRTLPSIDSLLSSDLGRETVRGMGHDLATDIARSAVSAARNEVLKSDPIPGSEGLAERVAALFAEAVRAEASRGLMPVINATGVVIHTNLGRAPLSAAATEAVTAASGYCTIEYDIMTGKRGSRGGGAEALVRRLTGAEAALVVNNCAAAALLVLTAVAKGREVIVARGELVEIGGGFRIPDVLAESGCTLREVGTTNRTKLSDFEKAIGERTAAIMRVHPSNYRIVGFTESPSNRDLARLARDKDVITFEDAGSGALFDLTEIGLGDEPVIRTSIEDGVDVVCFSGDKLLGGPQAGIIAGRGDLIEKIRKHPLYRAVRADKMVYAALEATLRSFLRGTAMEDVPVLRMLSMSIEKLEARVSDLIARVEPGPAIRLSVIPARSAVGGGAAPHVQPETVVVAIESDTLSADDIEERLRAHVPPVLARIDDGRVLLDLRTVSEDQEESLSAAISALAG